MWQWPLQVEIREFKVGFSLFLVFCIYCSPHLCIFSNNYHTIIENYSACIAALFRHSFIMFCFFVSPFSLPSSSPSPSPPPPPSSSPLALPLLYLYVSLCISLFSFSIPPFYAFSPRSRLSLHLSLLSRLFLFSRRIAMCLSFSIC